MCVSMYVCTWVDLGYGWPNTILNHIGYSDLGEVECISVIFMGRFGQIIFLFFC